MSGYSIVIVITLIMFVGLMIYLLQGPEDESESVSAESAPHRRKDEPIFDASPTSIATAGTLGRTAGEDIPRSYPADPTPGIEPVPEPSIGSVTGHGAVAPSPKPIAEGTPDAAPVVSTGDGSASDGGSSDSSGSDGGGSSSD